MEISIISFTQNGMKLSRRIQEKINANHSCILYTKCKCHFMEGQRPLREEERDIHVGSFREISYVQACITEWAGTQFQKRKALLFIGACGIAVRAIAPWARDKLTDSPVLVMDEAGKFLIPLLSGHAGGANELAKEIAKKMGATPVITTATDVNGLFAVDVFAVKNKLEIADRDGIAKISSTLLAGKSVTMKVEGECIGTIPNEIELLQPSFHRMTDTRVCTGDSMQSAADILVSVKKPRIPCTLHLIPKAILLGIGCRRGKPFREIEAFVFAQLKKAGIPLAAVAAIASIDRKKEEPGLLEFTKAYRLPFLCFSEEALAEIPGAFTSSSFVRAQVGVDNVCERAAVAAAGNSCRLIVKKTAQEGITLAAAEKKWSVNLDEA